MRVARRVLAPDGLFLVQTIGGNRSANLAADYDRTLMAWNANLESRWDVLPRYGTAPCISFGMRGARLHAGHRAHSVDA